MEYLNPALDGQTGSTTRQKLDGIEYRITVTWLPEVARAPFYDETTPPPPLVLGEPGVWVLSLAQADGTPLLTGQALRHGINVLAGYTGDIRFPGAGRGQLLAWDTSGNARDPGRDDLDPGSACLLTYRTAAEVAG